MSVPNKHELQNNISDVCRHITNKVNPAWMYDEQRWRFMIEGSCDCSLLVVQSDFEGGYNHLIVAEFESIYEHLSRTHGLATRTS